MYFLTGFPRSGSTLLKCLLNQRPDTYASNTSNLSDMIEAFDYLWKTNTASPVGSTDGLSQEECIKLLQHQRYANIDKPVIFDKSRGWTDIIELMKKVQDTIKIVATVRPVNECIASGMKIFNPDNLQGSNVDATLKIWLETILGTYTSIKTSYEKYPDNFLLIEYSDLVNNTQDQMDRISDFIGVKKFDHDLNNVPPSNEEDKVWGIKDLHKVRSKVQAEKYNAQELIGDHLWKKYEGGEFWNDKPEPKRDNVLDLQLEAGLHGDFKKGWEIAQQLQKKQPDNHRANFNRGWYVLRQGKLLEGHKLLDDGRMSDVFGNCHIGSSKPIWNGEEGTVLLNLEGGLGDQINGYRWAFDLQNRGNRVIISCSPEIGSIFAKEFTVVDSKAACGVYHDYWLPSMSAIVPFKYEYQDLKGTPYIQRTADPIPVRIGVRWSGNPQFEQEQYRFFSADLMFDAVKGYDCISLQRDKDSDLRPTWMKQALLHDWETTQKSISECELVISSCTSVAHLSAAMGIETWIVVPVLSYYLWALPGNKSPYYDSVTLFRQKKYGAWEHPFSEIKEKLKCSTHVLKMAA